eukprot:12411979-Karenia_brevis.AAC.1
MESKLYILPSEIIIDGVENLYLAVKQHHRWGRNSASCRQSHHKLGRKCEFCRQESSSMVSEAVILPSEVIIDGVEDIHRRHKSS